MRQQLTDVVAKKVAPGLYFDMDKRSPPGFVLRVTPAGARAWCLNYRVKDTGRERRLTIGDVASWPIKEAREKAAELRRIVDAGGDPLGELQEKRAAPSFAELVERYQAERLRDKAPRTAQEERRLIKQWLLPEFGSRKLAAIERADVERLYRQITGKGTLIRANRALSTLSAIFKAAVDWKLIAENPCRGVKLNREHGRARYMDATEITRLTIVLDELRDQEPDGVDCIEFMLLTGCRRGEALTARWRDIDLDAGVWTKPPGSVKTRREHRVPISPNVVTLLRNRRTKRAGAIPLRPSEELVFPLGGGDLKPREGKLDRAWFRIRRKAGIADVRMHDLRHSFASTLIGEGLDLYVVGKMLGHARTTSTARYAHLSDGPLRAAAEIMGRAVRGKGAK
jgi:integrase